MYYLATNYWYPHCCLNSPRVNRFVMDPNQDPDALIFEFRPRFGNGFLKVDQDMTYGLTANETYPVTILDAGFQPWRTLSLTVDADGHGVFADHAMDAEGTLVGPRLSIREIMRIAGTEIGAAAGALLVSVDKSYTGAGSADSAYIVLTWEAV